VYKSPASSTQASFSLGFSGGFGLVMPEVCHRSPGRASHPMRAERIGGFYGEAGLPDDPAILLPHSFPSF
jgi:hypothetical protein